MPEQKTYHPGDAAAAARELETLMERLRAPNGCPWDREQNWRTLLPYTVEETYEVMEAVENNDPRGVKEELGDLMFHVVFYSQIAREQGLFDLAGVISGVTEKMRRRHPHVFGDVKAETTAEIIQHWEAIKRQEKGETGENAFRSLFADLNSRLPALLLAHKMHRKMAKVGFDWPDEAGVLGQIRSELAEVEHALSERDDDGVEEEIGDLLFTIVNLAARRGINGENALRRSALKFVERFRYMEMRLAEQGRQVEGTDLDELETLWQESKARPTEGE
ncbi:MAG: nucleoside triphosphate pyrophosphohydrolase [Magnetococcales bacterium]|nr:nucleoside triphosphate pyrophosphohydrolase [Magnetococcales bacterium]